LSHLPESKVSAGLDTASVLPTAPAQYYANCDATAHVACDPASIGHHGLEAHCTPPTAAQFASAACPFIHGAMNKQVKRKKDENPNRFTDAPERRFKRARTGRLPQAWQ
jgi:hypothetical protein